MSEPLILSTVLFFVIPMPPIINIYHVVNMEPRNTLLCVYCCWQCSFIWSHAPQILGLSSGEELCREGPAVLEKWLLQRCLVLQAQLRA